MADEEDIAALVIDNGSGMCKGRFLEMFGFICRQDYDGVIDRSGPPYGEPLGCGIIWLKPGENCCCRLDEGVCTGGEDILDSPSEL